MSISSTGDPAFSATGFFGDAELGWRFTRWLSASSFGSLGHLYGSRRDGFTGELHEGTVTILDLGGRAALHAGPVYAGLGIGLEKVKFGDEPTWKDVHRLIEIDIGWRIPLHHGIAVDLQVRLGQATFTFGRTISSGHLGGGIRF